MKRYDTKRYEMCDIKINPSNLKKDTGLDLIKKMSPQCKYFLYMEEEGRWLGFIKKPINDYSNAVCSLNLQISLDGDIL